MKIQSDIFETTKLTGNSQLKNILSSFKSFLHKYSVLIVFILIWELLPIMGLVNPLYVPPPTEIAGNMWSLTVDGELPIATLYTFFNVMVGLALAVLIALPLGLLLGGFFKKFEKATNPIIRLVEQGNPLTLYHLFVLLIGVTELSTVIVVYWAAQWPILNNTVTGARNVDPVLIKVGKDAGLSKSDIFWKIQLPAATPTIFTGLRLGVLFGFLILMGVEMMGMGSGVGLGYFIMSSQMEMIIPRMWAGIVTLALLTITINLVLIKIEKHLTRWKDDSY